MYDKEKDDSPFVSEEQDMSSLPKTSSDGRRYPRLLIRKSVQSRNQKSNPVAFWKASSQRISGLEFSPDRKFLAVVSEDGSLRIFDYLKEQ